MMTNDAMLALLREPSQPTCLYHALEAETQRRIGHRLFTLLYVDGDAVARVYSSRPDEYPVSGRKHMDKTPWGDLVLRRREIFLGVDDEAIRWAFFDHEQIARMGLGCVINIPVIYDGQTIGTMNLLDVAHSYTEEHVAQIADLAPLLIPAYLTARAAGRSS
ncbi:GAF domain-containing protein [Rhizobium sp. CSW-27]|uniref:GAF domain-containing protein n=1 Tax=Rhizobium sp. CSW-27 TaxID=2839985 RepID=UPI0020788B14|nr:GAF domain-containing protein [Rhizobium sp. CSW-27]